MGNVELSHAPGAAVSPNWVADNVYLSTLSAGSMATATTTARRRLATLRSIAGACTHLESSSRGGAVRDCACRMNVHVHDAGVTPAPPPAARAGGTHPARFPRQIVIRRYTDGQRGSRGATQHNGQYAVVQDFGPQSGRYAVQAYAVVQDFGPQSGRYAVQAEAGGKLMKTKPANLR